MCMALSQATIEHLLKLAVSYLFDNGIELGRLFTLELSLVYSETFSSMDVTSWAVPCMEMRNDSLVQPLVGWRQYCGFTHFSILTALLIYGRSTTDGLGGFETESSWTSLTR